MSTEFWNAIREGDLGTAWVRLGGLETVNGQEPESGNTPLHFCALNGETALCMMLYMRGAQIQTLNNDLETPLHCAAIMGNYQLCCFLLKAGANPQAVDINGKFPVDNVPPHEEDTRKILNIGRIHPHLAKDLASALSLKREPQEAHFKKLAKLEALVVKQQQEVKRLEDEMAHLEAASASLPAKEYKKTLQRLQKKRSQLDSNFENNAGSLASRKSKKRKLSWLSLFM